MGTHVHPEPADVSTRQAISKVLGLTKSSKALVLGTAAFSALNAAGTIALPLMLPFYLVSLASGGAALPIIGVAAAVAAKWVGLAGSGRCSVELGTRMGVEVRKKVTRRATKLLGETNSLSPAEIAQATQESIPNLRAQLLNGLREVTTIGATVIGGAAALVMLFVPIGGVALVTAPAWLAALGFTGIASGLFGVSMVRKLRPMEVDEQNAALEIGIEQQHLNEKTVSFLRSLGREQEPAEALDAATDSWGSVRKSLNLRQMYVQIGQGYLGDLLTFGLPAAVILLGLAGAPFVPLITAVGLSLSLCNSAIIAPWILNDLTSTVRSAARSIARVVDAETTRDDRPDAISRDSLDGRPTAIELDRVTYRHGKNSARALDDLSLSFPETGMFAITGANGAGKSTLLKVAADYFDPQSGKVLLDGIDRSNFLLASRRAGILVSQDAVLYGKTVGDALRLERPSLLTNDHLAAMLKQLGLDELLQPYEGRPWHERPTEQVSGGERQRLALAAAALVPNATLFLDEPLNHLGPVEMACVMRTLRDSSKTRPIVLVTHNLDVVYNFRIPGVFVQSGKDRESWINPQKLPSKSRFITALTAMPRLADLVPNKPRPCGWTSTLSVRAHPPQQTTVELSPPAARDLQRAGWPSLPICHEMQGTIKSATATRQQLLAGCAAIIADDELRTAIGLPAIDVIRAPSLEALALDLGKIYWRSVEFGGNSRESVLAHFRRMTTGGDYRQIFFRNTPALANAVAHANGWDPRTLEPFGTPSSRVDVAATGEQEPFYALAGRSMRARLSITD